MIATLITPAPKPNRRGKRTQPTLLLAHGAGAPMDSPFMTVMADQLAARGVSVVRFEFGYMAARRTLGKRRPPPKAETLREEFLAAVASLSPRGALLIGGKSLGGRVASLIGDELFDQGRIAGVICLGYPFHPPQKPASLRTARLGGLRCPVLIVQGEADPFGTRAEVEGYPLSNTIRLHWIAQADHDLAPKARPGMSKAAARTLALAQAADAIAAFADEMGSLTPARRRMRKGPA